MYVGPGSGNKRDEKAAGKLQEQMEKESVRRGESMISRSTTGRFEGKYKVGDKTMSGAIIKEVNEDDWQQVVKDKKGNTYYKCLHCDKASRVMKSDRKLHGCKKTK